MNERLSRALDNIRSQRDIARLNEASVRQVVVLQILAALEWDQFNHAEVTPEFAVGSGRVDYSLQTGGQSKFFIEVKGGGEALLPHQGQLLRYSFERGVSLAVLTNGLDWWFYLPLREGSWEERRFSGINVMSEDRDNVEAVLLSVLSKDRVESGSAIEYGETLLERRRKDRIVNDTLPKAWSSLVSEPDEFLVELLVERVEHISKITPDSSLVRNFILDKVTRTPNRLLTEPTHPAQRAHARSTHRAEPIPQTGNVSTAVSSTGRPSRGRKRRLTTGFRFQGESFQVSQWKSLLQTLSGIIYLRHPAEFDKVLELRGRTRDYYSTNPEDLHTARPVGDSGYYLETNLNSELIEKLCHRLLRLFGYQNQDLEIEIDHT